MGTYIEKGKEPQIKALRGYTYRDKEGDILSCVLDTSEIVKINSVLVVGKRKPTTVGEILNCLGLVIAARSQNAKGCDLFYSPKKFLFKQYPFRAHY